MLRACALGVVSCAVAVTLAGIARPLAGALSWARRNPEMVDGRAALRAIDACLRD